jgi:protease-4
MGNQALSGGYYVSAPASAIIAQPTTLTGSIGIWSGKVVTAGLFQKMQANREAVTRGKAAGLYADTSRFSDDERAKIRADIGAGYDRFKSRVAQGRDLSNDEVEAIARGRVWTGEQALAHGLIDELGDLRTACDKARKLANLDEERYPPLVAVPAPGRYQLPTLPPPEEAGWLDNLRALLREGAFALAPWELRIGG